MCAEATTCASSATTSSSSIEATRGRADLPMAAVSISDTPDGRRILALSGRLDSTTLPDVWNASRRAASEAPTRPLVVDAADVDYCDGAGAALFVELLRHPREGAVEV